MPNARKVIVVDDPANATKIVPVDEPTNATIAVGVESGLAEKVYPVAPAEQGEKMYFASGWPFDAAAKSIFDQAGLSYYPSSVLPRGAYITKLRADYLEFAVYTPLSPDGIKWCRWFSSTRFRAGVGAPDIAICTLALLQATQAVAEPAENRTTGITAAAPTQIVAAADAASRTGTWTGPVTVSSVTGLYWSATTGDEVSYSVTVAEGGWIFARAAGVSSNGGIGAYTVKLDGVEIDAGNYLGIDTGSARIVDYTKMNAGLVMIPLAKNLPAGTYTVQIVRDAASQASGRLYDGGVYAFGPIAHDAVGVYGTAIASASTGGIASALTIHPGTVAVFEFPSCTKIRWRYVTLNSGGKADVTVYDAAGGVVHTETIDAYSSGTTYAELVVDGLTQGDHYLHVEVRADKNGSSSDRRIYFGPGVAVDGNTAGVPGVDAFDDLSMPASPSSAGNVGTHVLCGPGNLDYAASWRDPDSDPGDENFVGGTHGYETDVTNANMTVTVDGEVVDWAGASAGAAFAADNEVRLSFASTLRFPDWPAGDPQTGAEFATLTREWVYSRDGWRPENDRIMTSAGICHDDYVMMLQTPNGNDARCDSVGGPPNTVWVAGVEGSVTLDQSDNSSQNKAASNTFLFEGSNYAVVSVLESVKGSRVVGTLLRDLTSNNAKAYARGDISDQVNGVPIAPGDELRVRKRFRVLEIA